MKNGSNKLLRTLKQDFTERMEATTLVTAALHSHDRPHQQSVEAREVRCPRDAATYVDPHFNDYAESSSSSLSSSSSFSSSES